MAKNYEKSGRFVGCSLFLLISIGILFLNNLSRPSALAIAFFINNTVYHSYSFFEGLPEKFKTHTANQKLLTRLIAENTNLKLELSRLDALKTENTYLNKTNLELSKLLNLYKTSRYSLSHMVTAEIYNQNFSSNTATAFLKVGTEEGVINNSPVVFNNALVGRIFDATQKNAKIMLITDSNSRVSVVSEASGIESIMVGNNTLYPILNTYVKNKTFIEGEEIVTSGLGGIFPRNILVGTVVRQNNRWVVKLNLDIYNLDYVHILLTNKK